MVSVPRTSYRPASFDEPEGYIEGTNQQELHPRSLYLAQLEERKKNTTGIEEKTYPLSIKEKDIVVEPLKGFG